MKYWMHITKEEQLKRFRERADGRRTNAGS